MTVNKKKIILPLTIGLLIASTNSIAAQAEELNDNPTITENSYQEPGEYVDLIDNEDIVNTTIPVEPININNDFDYQEPGEYVEPINNEDIVNTTIPVEPININIDNDFDYQEPGEYVEQIDNKDIVNTTIPVEPIDIN